MINSSSNTGKKWYQKPENLTSAIFIAFLSFVGYNYGAGLLSGALNLMGFVITMGVITLIAAFFVTQHRLVGTLWNVSMYKLTNSIYSIDPISIAWTRLNSLKEKAEKINKAVSRIGGALGNTIAQINKNEKEIKQKEEEVRALNTNNRINEMKLVAKQIDRLNEWNTSLIPLRDTMQNMKNGMNKLYEAAEFVIKDKEDELTSLEKRYESVKIGWAAVKEAQGIYGKNSADRNDLEQLIGMADTDMNNKLAEMDRFMELAAPVFMQTDIENTMNDQRSQDIINKLTSGEIDQVIQNLQNPNTPAQVQKTDKVTIKNSSNKSQEPVMQTNSSGSKSDYDVLN